MSGKLSEFLDGFQGAYQEWSALIPDNVAGTGVATAAPSASSLDSLYGDLTSVITELLDLLDGEASRLTATAPVSTPSSPTKSTAKLTHFTAEVVNKVLNVAEMILKDEKYRVAIAKSPLFINRILQALEKLNGSEAKRIALRLLSSVGSTTSESRMAIGQNEGFRKMFLMMVSEAADTELTAELLRTVRTLVVDDGNAGSTGTSAAHHVFPEDSASSSGRSLWADVQFFMTGEAVKAFPGFFESASTTTSAFGVADKVIPDAASSSNSARYTVTANTLQGDPVAEDTLDFIPSDESVRRVLSHLEGHSSAAMPDSSASPSAIAVNELDDALYQLVRDQGALQSLVDTLHCKATTLEPAGRLDVLHTICKLIHRNRACQRDFKEIGGYAALSSLFDHLDDKALASFEVRTRFFTDAFNLFAAVCVDGNEHGFVDNVDALDTVVRIAANASNLDARKAALSTIQDLVSLNRKNAIVVWKQGFVDALLEILDVASKAHLTEPQLAIALNINVPATPVLDAAAAFASFTFPKSDRAPGSGSFSSPLYDYLVQLVNLLNYLAVILGNHNQSIMLEYTRLLMELDWPIRSANNEVVVLILRSVARLLEDVLAKEKQALAASTPPPDAFVKLDHDKFLNIYLQLLRRIYGMETSQQPRPVEDQRSDGESCSGTSRAHSPSPSRAAYDHRIRDQYLLLLEIVALLMEANGRDMVRFDALFGWDVLETGIVRSCDVGDLSLHLDFDVSPLDVVDMCTWMLKEYTVTAVEQDVAAQRSSPEKNDRSRCSSRASRCSVEHIIPVEPPVAPMTRCMRVLAAVTSTDPTSLPSSPSMSSASLAHDDVVFPSLDGGLGSAASPPSTAACASTADSGVVQLEHGHPLYWGLCSKIVGMFSMLFRHDHGKEDMEVAEMLRSTFCNNDGFEMLMNLLRHAANRRHLLPPGFMVKILTTLVDLVSCSDATKLYVCDTIGLDRVLAYLRDTGMLAERASWELLVHLAVATRSPWSFSALFRGKTLVARDDGFCGVDPDSDSMRNLMDVASDCASGSNITNAISETVQRCIQDIVTPHILFDAPLRPCAGRTFDINVIPLHTAGLHTRSGSDVTKTTDQSQSSPGILPRNGRFLRHHRSQGSIGAFAPITCEDTKTVRPSASAMFLRPLTNLVSQVTSGVTSGSTVIVDGAGRSHSKRRSHDRKSSQDRREVKGLDMRLPAHISESVPQLAIHQRLSQRSELSSKKSAQRTKEAKAESRARKLAQFQSIMLTARHLSGIVIRDSDAARTLFKLLLSMDCLSVFTHREFAKLVLLLAESNATSRQLLAECEEIPALFDLVIGRVIQDEQLDMSTAAHVTSGHRLLWQLLSTLYMFRINASDAARMFDVVANVANATVASSRKFPSHLSEIDITDRRGYPGDSDSMRSSVGSLGAATTSVDVVNNGVTNVVTTQILATINAIASHREPRFQFSLDGRGGCFMSGPLDSFPSARHGFTLSCWIKPVAFTCAETGFFSLDDRHKQLAGPACPATPPLQHNSFELFFREIRGFQRIPMFPRKSTATQSNLASGVAVDLDTPNGSARYCLAIRMHHSPSSPEDFVFDAYDFSKKAGAWSLITFSHHRSSLSLFVDGALVQTCSSFTYPKVSSYKEKALVAVVGRKKVNVKKAEPSRQSGADLPANVATTSSSWFGGFWGSTTAVTPSCDTTAAPTPAADTTPSVTTGSFFGSISPIDIIEGAIDPSTICRLYNAGPSNKYFLRQSGLEPLRVVHVLHPQQAKMPSIHEMVPLSAATGRLSSLSMLETESVRHFSRIQPLTASNASIATHFSSALVDVWPAECEEEHRTAVDLAEGCRVHAAVSFRDVFADIGGFPVVFKLVATMDQSIRLSGLRILASLLRQDQSRTAEFVETQGWNVLTALLSADPSAIDISIVDVLLEMACDSERRGHTRLLRRPYAFRLVADLVLLSDDAVQQHAIRQCTEMILKVPENYSVWREQFGIQYMFDVLCCGSRAVRGQIFTALDTLFDSMEVGDVGMLLDFVAHDKRQNQDVKFELMAILVRHCLYNENLVAHVNALGGISLLISFLHAPMERLRNSVLTLLGVLMSGNVRVNRPLMVKSALFDGLCLLMASFELSRDTCSILFGLALNWYVCDERNDVRHKKMFGADVARTASGGDVVSSGRLVDPLQYPEMLNVLLELMKTTANAELLMHTLADFQRLLTSDNLRVLWECPWAEWFSSFIAEVTSSRRPQAAEICHSAYAVVQKIMVYDLHRRNSATARLRGALAEDEDLQFGIVNASIEYFLLNSTLGDDTAQDVLRNLSYLYRHMEEYMPLNAGICTRFALCINQLSAHNNATIRAAMKTIGLFDVRDEIVLRLLRADLCSSDISAYLSSFPFEHVANQSKFRDQQGLLLVLRLFHRSAADRTLQRMVGVLLVDVLFAIELNRKMVARLLGDDEVMQRFSAATSCSTSHGAEHSSKMDAFLDWYYAPTPDVRLKRNAIEQRIESLAIPVVAAHQRFQERVTARRNKRIALAKDVQLRNAQQLNRSLTDFKARSAARLATSASAHQECQDSLRRARYERRRIGEEAWRRMMVGY